MKKVDSKVSLAEEWGNRKPPDWDHWLDYMEAVDEFDSGAYFELKGGKPHVVFSDNSTHCMIKEVKQ
jgi:hypothetical protein